MPINQSPNQTYLEWYSKFSVSYSLYLSVLYIVTLQPATKRILISLFSSSVQYTLIALRNSLHTRTTTNLMSPTRKPTWKINRPLLSTYPCVPNLKQQKPKKITNQSSSPRLNELINQTCSRSIRFRISPTNRHPPIHTHIRSFRFDFDTNNR